MQDLDGGPPSGPERVGDTAASPGIPDQQRDEVGDLGPRRLPRGTEPRLLSLPSLLQFDFLDVE